MILGQVSDLIFRNPEMVQSLLTDLHTAAVLHCLPDIIPGLIRMKPDDPDYNLFVLLIGKNRLPRH